MEAALVILSLTTAAFAVCTIAATYFLLTAWSRIQYLENEVLSLDRTVDGLRTSIDKIDVVLDGLLSGGRVPE